MKNKIINIFSILKKISISSAIVSEVFDILKKTCTEASAFSYKKMLKENQVTLQETRICSLIWDDV
jgi:hypothetical protein